MMTSRDDDGYDAPKQREDVQRKKRSSSSSFLSRAKSCGAGLMLMRGLITARENPDVVLDGTVRVQTLSKFFI